MPQISCHGDDDKFLYNMIDIAEDVIVVKLLQKENPFKWSQLSIARSEGQKFHNLKNNSQQHNVEHKLKVWPQNWVPLQWQNGFDF